VEAGVIDPLQVLKDLDGYANELDGLSKSLQQAQEMFVPVKAAYEDAMAEHEVRLWEEAKRAGEKMPREKLTERLGHRSLPIELWAEYVALTAKQDLLMRRVASLKSVIDGKRSVLSALREEMAAAGR
jgi:hypothetical protein